ncbi:zinc finger protein 70-like [Oncorhynchus masou masou]|uniref:zinc finger protein 70-like n=1 Tax=Oncorhynchus masou masou TaxID=90313 RepID=UPI003183ABA3
MSTLQMLQVFLNERLTAAAVEIFGAVEKTVVEYQEENDNLRRLLQITPDINLFRKESLQLSLVVTEDEVPPEQQHCEQERRTSLQQEDREPKQIKEEQEELWTCQEEEQLQGQEADSVFKFPLCVKSKCDQENPLQSFTLPQTQTVENRESASKPVDLPHFVTFTHLKGLNIPCDPPDNQNDSYSHSSAVSSDPVGLRLLSPFHPSPPLNPNLSMGEHCCKPNTLSRNTLSCCDCGETFALKADLQEHVTLAKKRPSECCLCKKQYNSTCKLKAHIRLCHVEKPSTCPFCGKTFKLKGYLSRHMKIHTGEKPFSCGDCGKSFIQKGDLMRHILTHTGEKPFSCGGCGKSFNRKGNLTEHIRTCTY